MSSLPDKGEKLCKQMDDIERAVNKLNKRIADLKPRSKESGIQVLSSHYILQ